MTTAPRHDGQCGLLDGSVCSDPAHADDPCPRCSGETICCWPLFWLDCCDCDGIGTVENAELDDDDDDVRVDCESCDGFGGWYSCDCDENGQHGQRAASGEITT